jgi:hypothetical protein
MNRVTTNDVCDYINLLVMIAHIIYNHAIFCVRVVLFDFADSLLKSVSFYE